MTLTQSYETQRDLLVGMDYHRGNTLVTQRTYSYDTLGRPLTRSTARNGQTVNDIFVHNSRSELSSATVNGITYGYTYDNIGNRTTAQEKAEEITSYQSNAFGLTNISESGKCRYMSLRDLFYSIVALISGLSSTNAEEMNGACLTFPDGSLEVIIDKTCDKETFKGIQLWSECKYSAARTVFQKQALKGEGLAKSALGLMIIQGYDGEPDYEQGIKLLEDGAESGWIEAYFYLAYIYGTPGKHQNYEKAYNYALKAAEKDNGSALIRLSETYMELYAEKKDMTLFREAIRCAYTAGKMGNMQGYDYAAYACFTIHAYNAKESARVLEDLVPLSDDAKGIILEILFSEKQFTECERRAKEFLSQYDYAFARYTLALLYLKHINPEINTEKGLKLMREGADKGDSKCIWGMVCVCENPHLNAPGKKQLKPDYEQALFWYREAEKLDDELSQATAKAWIARYYYEGKGCKRDISYAAKMLHESISLCTTEESDEFLSEVKEKSRKGSKEATEFLKIYNDLK